MTDCIYAAQADEAPVSDCSVSAKRSAQEAGVIF